MKSSQIFLECERFLKRALKDKGHYSKGAVIAFLITGGIGVSVPSTVHAVVPTHLMANLGILTVCQEMHSALFYFLVMVST